MAALQLTDDEIADVRLQLGAQLTAEDISDNQIISENMLGAATDYVFERVIDNIDLEKLNTAERTIAERFRDETPEDIAAFINIVLKPPQRQQMRRAVVYRTAGLCTPVLRRNVVQNFGGVGLREEIPSQGQQQQDLFDLCDAEIDRLRSAFPDDAFLSTIDRVRLNQITMITTTGS